MRNPTITGAIKRRGLGIGLGAAFLFAITSASAATITVDSLADVVDTAAPCTLREAIINANGNLPVATNGCAAGAITGDDIVFSVSGTITLNGTELPTLLPSVITDPLSITGPITIDADGQSRIFTNAGTTTLANLTLINGVANGDGNPANSGGAILNTTGGVLTVMGGAMNNNTAVRAGGAVEEASGAVTGGAAAVTLTDVDFSGNNAGDTPGNGGVLHVSGQGDVVVSGGTFDTNVAMEGGALWNGSGSMTVTDSAFTGNSANGSAASQGGGALFNNGGTLTVNTATITGNSAPGTLSDAAGTNGSGGGILNNGGTLTVNASTISNNSAVRAGGGIEDDSREFASVAVNLTNVTMDANETGPAPGNGGALHVTGAGTVTVNGGSFTNNIAANEGGGLWNFGTATMTIDGSTDSGTVVIDSNLANGAVTDATATPPTANGGGGLFNNGGNMIVIAAQVTNNQAPNGQGSGGGILNSTGGQLSVTGSLISTNSAVRAGGGIETQAGSQTSITLSSLQGNTAGGTNANPGNGGGLHVSGDGDVTISSSLVASNTAASEGGGLWNSAGDMDVNNTSVLSNTASGAAADNGGGGIFNNAGTLTVIGGRIAGNAASGTSGSGGGIFNTVTANVSGTQISQNSANRAGGGIENIGSLALDGVVLGGTDTSFGNLAGVNPGNGGALHNGAGSATVANSSVGYNTATQGGGLWNNSGATLSVTNTTVSNNQSTADGGGLYQISGGNSTLVNFSTVARNSAGGVGGGLAVGTAQTSAFVVESSIIAENTAGTSDDDFAAAIATLSNSTTSADSNALGVYRLFGGVTATHPLQTGSAAIDNADLTECVNTAGNLDQRGAIRPGDGGSDCDSGAFEVAGNPVITVTNTNRTPVTINSASSDVVVLALTLANNGTDDVTVGGFSGVVDINSAAIVDLVTNGSIDIFRDVNNNGQLDAGDTAANADVTVGADLTFSVQFDSGAGFVFAAGDSPVGYLLVGNSSANTASVAWHMPLYAGGTLLSLLGLFSIGSMRRRTRWILAIGVLAIGLTACGGDSNGSIGGGGGNPPVADNGPIQGDAQFVALTVDQATGGTDDFIIGDGLPVRGPALTVSAAQ